MHPLLTVLAAWMFIWPIALGAWLLIASFATLVRKHSHGLRRHRRFHPIRVDRATPITHECWLS